MNDTFDTDKVVSRYHTMNDLVFRLLSEEIFSGKLEPGAKLNIREIADRVGVSVTPVREALNQLASMGLVDMVPHRSPEVKRLSIDEIVEVYYIRAALEGISARLAATKLTESDLDRLQSLCDEMVPLLEQRSMDDILENNYQFHSIIYTAATSPRLEEMVRQLYRQCSHYRFLVMGLPGAYNAIHDEHCQIFDALASRDINRADAVAREHHLNSARRIAAAMGLDVTI